jgi:hypothetical protein
MEIATLASVRAPVTATEVNREHASRRAAQEFRRGRGGLKSRAGQDLFSLVAIAPEARNRSRAAAAVALVGSANRPR